MLRACRERVLTDQRTLVAPSTRDQSREACRERPLGEETVNDGRDTVDKVRAQGVGVTRASFIHFFWGVAPERWTAREEAQLPLVLQEWSLFEFDSTSELVLRPGMAEKARGEE